LTKKETSNHPVPKSLSSEAFSLLVVIILALGVRIFVLELFYVPTGSMKATILEGDYIFSTKYSYGYSISGNLNKLQNNIYNYVNSISGNIYNNYATNLTTLDLQNQITNISPINLKYGINIIMLLKCPLLINKLSIFVFFHYFY